MKLDLSISIDKSKAEFYLQKLIEKKAKIELKEVKKQRTFNQNSYLHVCLSIFCEHTGYTINESKEIFAGLLPELLTYGKGDYTFRKSTADLDTKEMTVLIDYVRSFCMNELGVYCPDSKEYLIEQFNLEKKYEAHK